jgi:hypothetical protein
MRIYSVGVQRFFWKKATAVLVGWTADRTCKNHNKLSKLLYGFYSIYTKVDTKVIYQCGRG